MKKYKSAIRSIRATIKTLSEEKPKMRAEIQQLTFDEKGERRPETGPDRTALRALYRGSHARVIRANLLAYGLLRGRPYSLQEPKVGIPVDGHLLDIVSQVILRALDDELLQAEWPYRRIKSLILEGREPDPLPEPLPPTVPRKRGFLEHLKAMVSFT